MTLNGQKWQKMTKCHYERNDRKWQIMTQKDQEYVLKLMWHPNINFLTFEMLKNYKNMFDCHYDVNDGKWQKMIENETINDWKCDGWLKQKQKNWKIVKRT